MQLKNWLIVAGLVLAGPVMAMQPVAVEYSADSYMETTDGIMQGIVYSAPGKERREYVESGEKMIMIVRHDKKVVWMLQPEEKTYMEMKLPKEGRKGDLSGYKMETTRVGEETVNGVRTTKNKMIMTGPKGDKLGGFSWVTKDNIVVKLDAIAVDKKSKERFKIELKNLKVGRQNAAQFEIPADYSKMDMGMGGLGNMMGRGSKDDKKQPQVKGEKKGFGWKDAVDLLK
jgi:outer membrane lipoprotein-sorting protein